VSPTDGSTLSSDLRSLASDCATFFADAKEAEQHLPPYIQEKDPDHFWNALSPSFRRSAATWCGGSWHWVAASRLQSRTRP